MRAMKHVGQELFGDEFVWSGVETSGNLDPLIFAEVAANNHLSNIEYHHERFRKHYLDRLPEEIERGRSNILVMPGMISLIDQLRDRSKRKGDVMLGLLSGNYVEAAPIKLSAIGLDISWFAVTAFGEEGRTRADLVALAIRRYEEITGDPPDPRRVVVIGDTPRDVACAHAHGCVAFAVATGEYDVNQLRDSGADRVVLDFSDPTPLFLLLDSHVK